MLVQTSCPPSSSGERLASLCSTESPLLLLYNLVPPETQRRDSLERAQSIRDHKYVVIVLTFERQFIEISVKLHAILMQITQ